MVVLVRWVVLHWVVGVMQTEGQLVVETVTVRAGGVAGAVQVVVEWWWVVVVEGQIGTLVEWVVLWEGCGVVVGRW